MFDWSQFVPLHLPVRVSIHSLGLRTDGGVEYLVCTPNLAPCLTVQDGSVAVVKNVMVASKIYLAELCFSLDSISVIFIISLVTFPNK